MRQEQEPAGLGVEEVGPGVLRVQLPVDIPGLGHVNTYVIPDRRGVTVVDPGMSLRKSRKALVHRLRLAGVRLADVHTVVITHSHPDHYGAAAWLAEAAGAEVMTHAAFSISWLPDDCDAHVHEVDPEDQPVGNPHDGPTPWGGAKFRPPLRHRLVPRSRHPRPRRRVRHGEVVRLADRDWVAVHTPGHTLDHLCLVDPEHGLLLSGDHLLPTITPHISGIGTGRDPLAAFLVSLDRIAALAPSVALPAHGHPFGDLAVRIDRLKAHHHGRLEALRQALADGEPASVPELMRLLFAPARQGAIAESETFAHLQHLHHAGVLERYDKDGRLVYRAAPPTAGFPFR
ncbi:MAG TPA: MBL fold metallo-hydrolase [Acidimicrobiales bacterium]|nr:MBL fold metallo-hydrolase [Acidimicrobiales bacterium]